MAMRLGDEKVAALLNVIVSFCVPSIGRLDASLPESSVAQTPAMTDEIIGLHRTIFLILKSEVLLADYRRRQILCSARQAGNVTTKHAQ